MDEILIEDKKYVSSKRAAKMTGYAKDYIGQLCREGRVSARLVGRSWYVLETAIQDHRFGTAVVESSNQIQSAPLTRGIHPTWEPPRYEAASMEILPSVNRLQSDQEKQEDVGVPKNLQESWQAWFDHVGNAEPAVSEDTSPEELEDHPPVLTEQAGEIEIERNVSIPIHTIYQLPPEELLPHRASVESAQDEPQEELVPEAKVKVGLSRGVIWTIQVVSIVLAMATATTAIVGSGYLDEYIISNRQAQIIAGVVLYNK